MCMIKIWKVFDVQSYRKHQKAAVTSYMVLIVAESGVPDLSSQLEFFCLVLPKYSMFSSNLVKFLQVWARMWPKHLGARRLVQNNWTWHVWKPLRQFFFDSYDEFWIFLEFFEVQVACTLYISYIFFPWYDKSGILSVLASESNGKPGYMLLQLPVCPEAWPTA